MEINPFAPSKKLYIHSSQWTISAKAGSNKLFDFLEKDIKTKTFILYLQNSMMR